MPDENNTDGVDNTAQDACVDHAGVFVQAFNIFGRAVPIYIDHACTNVGVLTPDLPARDHSLCEKVARQTS
jgi:hypothetical protein